MRHNTKPRFSFSARGLFLRNGNLRCLVPRGVAGFSYCHLPATLCLHRCTVLPIFPCILDGGFWFGKVGHASSAPMALNHIAEGASSTHLSVISRLRVQYDVPSIGKLSRCSSLVCARVCVCVCVCVSVCACACVRACECVRASAILMRLRSMPNSRNTWSLAGAHHSVLMYP